jgi:hypothetical protein
VRAAALHQVEPAGRLLQRPGSPARASAAGGPAQQAAAHWVGIELILNSVCWQMGHAKLNCASGLAPEGT